MIFLDEKQISEIKKHGERTYPNECCGLLIGQFERDGEKTVVEIFSIGNACEESVPHIRSLITPHDLMRGERYAREK